MTATAVIEQRSNTATPALSITAEEMARLRTVVELALEGSRAAVAEQLELDRAMLRACPGQARMRHSWRPLASLVLENPRVVLLPDGHFPLHLDGPAGWLVDPLLDPVDGCVQHPRKT